MIVSKPESPRTFDGPDCGDSNKSLVSRIEQIAKLNRIVNRLSIKAAESTDSIVEVFPDTQLALSIAKLTAAADRTFGELEEELPTMSKLASICDNSEQNSNDSKMLMKELVSKLNDIESSLQDTATTLESLIESLEGVRLSIEGV